MTSSGTYSFQMPVTSIVMEAFDRLQIDPTEQQNNHLLLSARTSINLELLDWVNRGMIFWKVISGTINIEAAVGTYTLPTNLVTLTDLWYSQVNADGAGVNQDRILVPMSRNEYAELPNKNQQGVPTRYWFQMLLTPQITLWQVPQAGQVAPNCVLNWFGLQQIQDANFNGTETPDIHYRATEALITGLTLRLCEKRKFANPQERQMMMIEKKTLADAAWVNFMRRDQEPGSIRIRLDVSSYGRL